MNRDIQSAERWRVLRIKLLSRCIGTYPSGPQILDIRNRGNGVDSDVTAG